jgi:translation initiation factor IF-1
MSHHPSAQKKQKNNNKMNYEDDHRPLYDGEFVGIVTKNLGNLIFEVKDTDNNTYKAKLKNSLRKKIRLTVGKICIIENILNIYEIVHVYSDEKEKQLKSQFKKDDIEMTETNDNNNEDAFEFTNEIDIDAI